MINYNEVIEKVVEINNCLEDGEIIEKELNEDEKIILLNLYNFLNEVRDLF